MTIFTVIKYSDMKYFVRILCVIMLAISLSLTTCQNTENSPREPLEPLVPANMRRVPERQHNQGKLWTAQFANVITLLLFSYLMLIISNRFLL